MCIRDRTYSTKYLPTEVLLAVVSTKNCTTCQHALIGKYWLYNVLLSELLLLNYSDWKHKITTNRGIRSWHIVYNAVLMINARDK